MLLNKLSLRNWRNALAASRDRLEELRAKARLEELRSRVPQSRQPTTRQPPQEREAREAQLNVARETESPALVDIGRSFANIVDSVKQAGALTGVGAFAGQDPQAEVQRLGGQIEERQRLAEPLAATGQGGPGSLAEFAGQVLPGLAIPGGAAQQPIRRALGAGLAGATEGVLTTPGGVQERALTGGVAGALGGATGLAGAGTGRAVRGGEEAAQRAQSLAQDARKLEIDPPLTVGELRGSVGIQRFERFLENFPIIGTNRFRSTQQRNLRNAAARIRDKFPKSSIDDIEVSFARVVERGERKAKAAFNRVERLSRNTKERVIPLNRQSVARSLLSDELAKGADQNPEVVRFLTKSFSAKPVDFKTARSIRSDLLKDARNSRARAKRNEATNVEASIRDRINEAFERDIEEFADRAGGGILESFRQANKVFVEGVLPFQKDRVLRQLGDTDTDTVISAFIKKGRPRLAKKLSDNLDERGNQALKFVILDDAFEQATRDGVFKPQTFATRLENLRQTTEAVFSPQESIELSGFVNLANAAQRAGRDTNILGSGLGVGGLGAAGLLSDTGTVGAAIASIGILSNLLTSKAGRRLLTKAGSGANRGLVDRAFKLAGEIGEKSLQRSASEQAERVIGEQ